MNVLEQWPALKNFNDRYDDGKPSYDEIVKAFGTVLIQKDEGSYQGSTLALVSKDGKYGVVAFGWGSCSGCDSLCACSSVADVQKLVDELEPQYRDLAETVEYLKTHDWLGDWWSEELTEPFVADALKLLDGQPISR